MTDEKLVELMNDARLISACDNVIFPLLRQRIDNRIRIACAQFRGGKTDFIADIAYIAGLEDVLVDLASKQTQGHKAIDILHNRQK